MGRIHEYALVFQDPSHPSVQSTFLPPRPTWLQAPKATAVVEAPIPGPVRTQPWLWAEGCVTQLQPVRALLLPRPTASNKDQCGGDLAATQDDPRAFQGGPGQDTDEVLWQLPSPLGGPSANGGRR